MTLARFKLGLSKFKLCMLATRSPPSRSNCFLLNFKRLTQLAYLSLSAANQIVFRVPRAGFPHKISCLYWLTTNYRPPSSFVSPKHSFTSSHDDSILNLHLFVVNLKRSQKILGTAANPKKFFNFKNFFFRASGY